MRRGGVGLVERKEVGEGKKRKVFQRKVGEVRAVTKGEGTCGK